jgi:hypothetical protein
MKLVNVFETHEHKGDFKEWWVFLLASWRVSAKGAIGDQ